MTRRITRLMEAREAATSSFSAARIDGRRAEPGDVTQKPFARLDERLQAGGEGRAQPAGCRTRDANARGDSPVQLLNARQNELVSAYPRSSATSPTARPCRSIAVA